MLCAFRGSPILLGLQLQAHCSKLESHPRRTRTHTGIQNERRPKILKVSPYLQLEGGGDRHAAPAQRRGKAGGRGGDEGDEQSFVFVAGSMRCRFVSPEMHGAQWVQPV